MTNTVAARRIFALFPACLAMLGVFAMPAPATKKKKRTPSRRSTFINVDSAPRLGEGSELFLVRPLFYFFCQRRLESPYICAPHRHNEFEVILVRQGCYACRLNGVKLELARNTALVVQPGDWHEDFCVPPLDYVGLRFTLRQQGSTHPPRFFRAAVEAAEQWSNFPGADYLPLLGKITAETSRQDAAASRIQDALLSELFWRLVRTFDPRLIASWLLPERQDERFQTQLHRCFAQNIAHALPVAQMARTLGISQRTLTQRCAKLFQVSPARAFLQFRIQQAQELLARTEMSVKEVSYRLGFTNPYHFSRVYKQVLGTSPSSEKGIRPQ